MKDVSVILPCLNEEKGVGICIAKILNVFQKEQLNGEIIVVDNGCTDKTIEIAKSFNDKRIKIVFEPKKGYGSAYLAGFKEVKGKIIIMGDADNSYDFLEVPRFIYELRQKKADFVVGNREVILDGAMPFLHRYVGRPVFYGLMRYVFRVKVSDSHCGFGVIKKEAYDKLNLKSSGMEFASEILIRAKKEGLKISEMPITYYPRQGTSKLRTFKDGFRHLNLMTRAIVNSLP